VRRTPVRSDARGSRACRPSPLALALALGVCLLGLPSMGCVATGQYKFLEPDAPGAVRESGYSNYRVIIVWRSPDQVRLAPLPGMDLVVRACNRTEVKPVTVAPFIPIIPWPPGIVKAFTAVPDLPLVVSINFASGVGYGFDPAKVMVHTPAGSFAPRAFAMRENGALCSPRPDGPLPDEPLYVRGPITVTLEFELPAIPEQAFSLEIGGVQAGSAAVAVPPIRLRRGSEWILYPFSS
jgi:hypothetical protein